MLEGFLSRFGIGPEDPAKAPRLIRTFTSADSTLSRDGIAVDGEGWRIDCQEDRTVRLFEVAAPVASDSVLTYRAAMSCAGLKGRAYLEMWCRLPGRGEFFSRGVFQAIKGTTGWSTYEVPFRLKKGQQPDLIKLNVVIEGQGTVGIRSVELLVTPR